MCGGGGVRLACMVEEVWERFAAQPASKQSQSPLRPIRHRHPALPRFMVYPKD
jgi:hypothetical protein